MTIRHLQLGPGLVAPLGLCVLLIAVAAMGGEAAPTEGRAAKAALPAKKSADTAPAAAKPATATAAKAKSRARRGAKSAKPAKVAAPEPETASDRDPIKVSDTEAAAAAKPTQVVDFDGDQVDGQRMEPGFELIQAPPKRARQPSLVKPLRPEDSVVGRE